jgi:hypothetical protein
VRTENPTQKPAGEFLRGLACVWLFNVLQAVVMAPFVEVSAYDHGPGLALIAGGISIRIYWGSFGLSQLFYVFPLLFYACRLRRKYLARGVVVAAIIAFLVGAYWWLSTIRGIVVD